MKLQNKDIIIMNYYTSSKNYIKYSAEKIPYPFKKRTFYEIYVSHILEHISNLWIENNKRCAINELCIIFKKDELLIIIPHSSVYYDWEHSINKRTCSINSFNFIQKHSPEKYTKNSFKIIKNKFIYNRLRLIGRITTVLINKYEKAHFIFEKYLCYYIGGFDEVYFELKKN